MKRSVADGPGLAALVVVVGLVALAVVPGSVAAHPGHGHGAGVAAWLPTALFLLGVGVLGASVYADDRDAVAGRVADLGVAVGVLAVLASIGVLFV